MTVQQNGVSNERLPWLLKYSYGVGHVFNDLCASMWFSYLLIYMEKVLEFSPDMAGLILLVGQLADGFSTPVVGILSDKENKIPTCARYGRRKVWHLIGSCFVFCSFPFIFSPCLGCQKADDDVRMIYYLVFVVLFQFGWASVQISHLALIPDLTRRKNTRTELNSIRYAFTVLSNLSVYTVAFFLLNKSQTDAENSLNNLGVDEFTSSDLKSSATNDTNMVCPQDKEEFRNMALFCVALGTIFTILFHIGVKEPEFHGRKKLDEVTGKKHDASISKLHWFKKITFYQIAALYMATRLYVNLYQVYIPLYVQESLGLEKSAIATVPFTMYSSGFLTSIAMKFLNKKLGRKVTYVLGCCVGLSACIWVQFGQSEAFKTWGIYLVACLLGMGGSTVLITSLSLCADLIGSNVEDSAFVYGFMSFVDKLSSGIVIMLIQNGYDNNSGYYQHVITYACGGACILGLLVIMSLFPVKIDGGRRSSNSEISSTNSTGYENEAYQKESPVSANSIDGQNNNNVIKIRHESEVVSASL